MTIYLQDYEQQMLLPLPVPGRALPRAEQVADTAAGRALTYHRVIETFDEQPGSTVRVWLALLGGAHPEGVMSAVVDRALAESESLSQLASLVAKLIITQSAYTDYFFLARRSQPMGLPAEMQWQLLPPRALSARRSRSRGS